MRNRANDSSIHFFIHHPSIHGMLGLQFSYQSMWVAQYQIRWWELRKHTQVLLHKTGWPFTLRQAYINSSTPTWYELKSAVIHDWMRKSCAPPLPLIFYGMNSFPPKKTSLQKGGPPFLPSLLAHQPFFYCQIIININLACCLFCLDSQLRTQEEGLTTKRSV